MPKRLFALVLTIVVVGLVGSGIALATNPFTDIAGNTHEANIDAIYTAGITTGCNQAGDNYCPNNPVTRGQMATFLARVAGLGKNFPKTNARSDRQTYCAYATANPASFRTTLCNPFAFSASQTILTTSTAIGTDGLPVVTFSTGQALVYLHCQTSACTSTDSPVTVDNTSGAGTFSSVAIGHDGLAVISYYNSNTHDLLVAHCANVRCTSSQSSTLDSLGDVGQYSSLAIGADTNPIVSYYDDTNNTLKAAHCETQDCQGAVTRAVVDDGFAGRADNDDVGQVTSLVVGTDGFPVIAYRNVTDQTLQIAHCTTATCSAKTKRTIGPMDNHSFGASIAVGVDGMPVMAYKSADTLRVAHCNVITCSSAPTITTIDDGFDAGPAGSFPALTIGSDGKPAIAYGANGFGLRGARCTAVDCTGSPVIRTVDSLTTSGSYNSIALGLDGIPVVATSSNFALRIAHFGGDL